MSNDPQTVYYCALCDDGPSAESNDESCIHCGAWCREAQLCIVCSDAVAVCDDQCINCLVSDYTDDEARFPLDASDSCWQSDKHWREAFTRICNIKMARIEAGLSAARLTPAERGAVEACARAVL